MDLIQALAEIERLKANAERYEKLRRWMSSNVHEGWGEVQKLAGIACYIGWDDFDIALDDLPVCNVGLCEVREKMCDCNQGRLPCTCIVIT